MCKNWYHHWVVGATLDDQLWHQALVMDHVLESLRGSEQNPNDAMMWTLLCQGVVNKPWDSSTRSMRYSAVLVDRLWGLLAGERTWVSVRICDPTTQLCSRVEPDVSVRCPSICFPLFPVGFYSASRLITSSPLSLLSPPFTLYLVTLHSFPRSFSMYA